MKTEQPTKTHYAYITWIELDLFRAFTGNTSNVFMLKEYPTKMGFIMCKVMTTSDKAEALLRQSWDHAIIKANDWMAEKMPVTA